MLVFPASSSRADNVVGIDWANHGKSRCRRTLHLPACHSWLSCCREFEAAFKYLRRFRGAAKEARRASAFNNAAGDIKARFSDQSLYGAFWNEISAERIQLISNAEAPGGVPELEAGTWYHDAMDAQVQFSQRSMECLGMWL